MARRSIAVAMVQGGVGTEKPAESRSPGVTVAGEHPDLPGEGELPRREDMGPEDHRARGDEGESD